MFDSLLSATAFTSAPSPSSSVTGSRPPPPPLCLSAILLRDGTRPPPPDPRHRRSLCASLSATGCGGLHLHDCGGMRPLRPQPRGGRGGLHLLTRGGARVSSVHVLVRGGTRQPPPPRTRQGASPPQPRRLVRGGTMASASLIRSGTRRLRRLVCGTTPSVLLAHDGMRPPRLLSPWRDRGLRLPCPILAPCSTTSATATPDAVVTADCRDVNAEAAPSAAGRARGRPPRRRDCPHGRGSASSCQQGAER